MNFQIMSTKKKYSDFVINYCFIEFYVKYMKSKGKSKQEIDSWFKEKQKKLFNR